MQNILRNLLLAMQFFTRLPLPAQWAQWADFSPARMQAAIGYMPAMGWLAGGVAAATLACVLHMLGTPWMWQHAPVLLGLLAAISSTAATVWLTGAMHEDGLADVADGLMGCADAGRALQIMKDPRMGCYAVLALALHMALKIALLATLALLRPLALPYLLVAAHVLSRFFPLLLIKRLPYVGLEGQSKTRQAAGAITGMNMWPAALCCLPLLCAGCLPQGGLLLAVTALCAMACAVVVLWMGRWFRRRLHGYTGDCLGATQQICEQACYMVALAALLHLGAA